MVLTIIALGVVVSMSNQVEYDALFTGLTDEEAGAVIAELEEMDISYVSGPNGTLMIPKDQMNGLKYKLQAAGLPSGDALDYSLYAENATSFGSTDKDKKYYEQAQLQQNLAQMISRLDKIKNCTVLLNLADESNFVLSSDENKESTASVMVTLKSGDAKLTEGDVAAIRSLVAQGVPALKEENVAIVDQYMNSYGSSALEETSGTTQVDTQISLQKKVSDELANQIVALLTPVFGAENLSASVNVILDFDKSTTNSLTLSPPTNDAENMGIITSMKMTEERLQNAGTVPQGEPGMDPNGGAPTYQEIDAAAQDSTYYNTVTEVNAEVNEISEQIEQAQGDITDLSATLIINGGDELADILPEVRQQIATAIGVPEGKITVSAMPFEQNVAYQQAMEEQQKQMEEMQRLDLIKSIVPPLAIAAAIVIVFLAVWNSIKKKREQELEEQRMQEWEAEQAQLAEQHIDYVADDEISVEDLLKEDEKDTLRQVQGIVDKNPDAIAQLLRNWLSDDLGGNS